MKALALITLVGLMVGAARAQTISQEVHSNALFRSDHNSPVKIKQLSSQQRDGIGVRDILITGSRGRQVKAYLVVPPGSGPFAGILWVHWLGEQNSNRDQFLDEAVDLAPKGVASLLVDAMWSTPQWFGTRIPEEDYKNSIRQVEELRRAMDLLMTQPNVDKGRIGYVGHDYGAMYGMLMAGVDQRAKTYVYIAATQSLNDWAFLGPQPKSKAAYLRQNADLELTDSLREVKNASTFFQFGRADFYVSQADAEILFAATREPRQRKIYEASHKMDLNQIVSDRDEWLVKELGLRKEE